MAPPSPARGEGRTPGRLFPSRPHAAEMQREHDGHRQHAEADRDPFEDHIRALGLEAPENREAGREIGKAPEDVDQRRGFADPRRRRERGLKAMPADALDKVRDAVREQQSADELQDVDVPRHLALSLADFTSYGGHENTPCSWYSA